MKLLKYLLTACLFFILPSTVLAAQVGLLGFGPVSTAIPTLGGSTLIVLSILMAISGYFFLNKKGNNASNKMIITLIGVGILSSGIGGIKLLNDAYAVAPPATERPMVGAGVLTIDDAVFINRYTNNTGADIKINSINFTGACPGFEIGFPKECAVNQIVPTSDYCDISCGVPD
jgi:hypothetical protein